MSHRPRPVCRAGGLPLAFGAMYGRGLSFLLVLGLVLWAAYAILATLVGLHLYFPFAIAAGDDIPYHRWQSVRLALFATFIFYGVMHLLFGSREVYPVHFLKTYLFMLSITGMVVFLQTGVEITEYLVIGFLFWVAIVLHFSSASRYRRVFGRK